MGYSDERLNDIFDKTDGYCHICHKMLCFSNYGNHGARGNWEVEHSIARANGGTDHLNNLFSACIKCNREKGTCATRTARARNGNDRAPYSRMKKQQIEDENTLDNIVIGTSIFIALGLLVGAISNGNSKNKQTLNL